MNNRIARSSIAAIAIALTLPLGVSAQAGKNVDNLLDPNRATKEELAGVPGMTAALADQIIAARPILDMMVVDRILATSLSEDQREAVYRKVFAPLNLNATSDEEILLIPGVGARWLREFKEYAPYAGLAEFHREIGKYTDDMELARLEQYVFVPIDLNTASDEDILSLPGVGARWLREFKEYRPYDSIEKFRREMGKYTNENEVKRLEHYVTIRK